MESSYYFTSFVGRRPLLTEVKQRLANSRVVTLTGPGGVGKTRLGLQALEDVRREYVDGAWAVDLNDLPDPTLVEPTVASAMGLQADAATREDFLTNFLADRRALLVLDGCEHAVSAVADLVARLCRACPRLQVLATSRQRLGLSGEAVVLVPPLTTPDPGAPTTPDTLSHIEAVALFVDRARLSSSDFRLTEENAHAVAELCSALEGVPLALELAAARVGTLSPQEMVEKLSDRFHLLHRGFRDAPSRHQSLRACVEWSFATCTEPEQALWCRMSVLPGGCDLAGAVAVCTGDGVDERDLLDLIGSLVDRSVLRSTSAPDGSVRYRMLDYIAAYGREVLEQTAQLHWWRRRQATWCAELVARFRDAWIGNRQAELLRQVRREHANLRAALEFCSTDEEMAEVGLTMATDLEYYWLTEGLANEALHWMEASLASGQGEPADRTFAMIQAARFAGLQEDLTQARVWLAQASEEAESTDDARTKGLLLALTAMIAAWDGDPPTAVDASSAAVAALHSIGDDAGEILSVSLAGACRGMAGDGAGAVAAYEQAIALGERTGETFRRAFSLAGLGREALARGEPARAAEFFSESLRMRVDLGDRLGIAGALGHLARTAAVQRDGERAAILLGASASSRDALGIHETANPFTAAPSSEEATVLTRGLLGKTRFRVAYRRGSLLTEGQAVAYALDGALDAGAAPQDQSPLTRREAEVAELVAEGLSNPEIAKRLVISVRTAQGHVENILRKLGFTSRAMIASWVTQRRTET